jgi:hypothetical protein
MQNAVLEHSGAPNIKKYLELKDKLLKYFKETWNNGNIVSYEMQQLQVWNSRKMNSKPADNGLTES